MNETKDFNYRIRTAEADDAHQIAELEKLTSSEPWSEEALLNDITTNQRALVIVAVQPKDERIVAYADVWMVADELQLNNIAVLPEYRKHGIAYDMLDILAHSGNELGCATMNLEVRASNEPAKKLYEKAGFKQVGIREQYYIDNNEDAILMDLQL